MADRAAEDKWISLGVITRPQGVTGELRVHLFNPDSTLLEGLDEIFLRPPEEEIPTLVRLLSWRRAPKASLLRLEGVESREQAEELRGVELCIPRSVLPPLDEGEFYFVDLIGLKVLHDGRLVGELVEVLDYPSVECFKVRTEQGFIEIPNLPEWIERVDLDAGEVHTLDLVDIPVQKKG